jgi:hypothetical protein
MRTPASVFGSSAWCLSFTRPLYPPFHLEGGPNSSLLSLPLSLLLPTLQVKVTTVDGPVELKIPSGTQPGTTLLMSKRGVPRLGNSSQRGDHQVGKGACL